MIDVAENSFRSRLLSKDKQGSLEYLKTNLAEEKLVSTLHDLIFFSVSVDSRKFFNTSCMYCQCNKKLYK